ncbi:hypothetical protein [Lyngbya confervoides]|uniref:SH2 domain-containing protein n=1 Tax=Lyngbya confervoides BDU141951 TaxID=1574623 RepID=A0ABD4TA99_9CYAN|nr:hypothetical protein [Lyngbya confervoides]MCM1985268.1 hypothetical protein [Lyngbya confervoides BDU141951]
MKLKGVGAQHSTVMAGSVRPSTLEGGPQPRRDRPRPSIQARTQRMAGKWKLYAGNPWDDPRTLHPYCLAIGGRGCQRFSQGQGEFLVRKSQENSLFGLRKAL